MTILHCILLNQIVKNTQQENYGSDGAITEKLDDKLQRYRFSKGVARAIIGRDKKNSIVFGLFGSWGEGKTVLVKEPKAVEYSVDATFIL